MSSGRTSLEASRTQRHSLEKPAQVSTSQPEFCGHPFPAGCGTSQELCCEEMDEKFLKNGITLFRMTFLPFCLLPFTTWEGASSEVYYRSIYLWLLDKVMGLTVPKPRKNTTCKMWGREFSKNCRPGPEAAVTAPLTGNVQGFLAMKQGIQFLLVKFQLQTWKSSYTKLLMNQNWRKESHELLPVETSDFSLALPLICC